MITVKKIEKPTKYMTWAQLDVGEAYIIDGGKNLHIKLSNDKDLMYNPAHEQFEFVTVRPMVTHVIPVSMNIEYWEGE